MLLVLLFIIFSSINSLKILILSPRTGTSHTMFMGNIADILHLDGHDVTLLSVYVDPAVTNIGPKEKGIKIIDYVSPYIEPNKNEINDIFKDGTWFRVPEEGRSFLPEQFEPLFQFFYILMKGIYEDKALSEQLSAEKFDVFITEMYDLSPVAMQHHFGIKKAIYASAIGFTEFVYKLSGVPSPSYVPTWTLSYDENPTFIERMRRVLFDYEDERIYKYWKKQQEDLYASFHEHRVDLLDFAKKSVGAWFLNSNLFTETPRPTAPIIRYIGGATIYNTTEREDKELDNLLNLRPLNVFFSMGSLVRLGDMPIELQKGLAEAFQEFPNVTFLTRYAEVVHEKHVFDKIPNVILKKWWPQKKLLQDERVSLFITHGGLNSVIETEQHGMPTISIPILADQILNSITIRNQNLSIHIPRHQITKEKMVEALTQALHPESPLRTEAKKAKAVLKGQPEFAREEIRKWTRIVGEYGQLQQFVLKGRDMSLLEQFNLDIYFLLLLSTLFGIFITGCICRRFLILLTTFMRKCDKRKPE